MKTVLAFSDHAGHGIGKFSRKELLFWPLAASAVSLFSYVMLHRHGMGLTPDGWAYWQGAISLAEGKGYSYFSGHPITAWPPLYSLYLDFWSLFFGKFITTLIIANCILIILQAFFWLRLIMLISSGEGYKISKYYSLIFACSYLGLFISLQETTNLAHNALYTILPIFLEIIYKILYEYITLPRIIFATLLSILMLLTHNSSTSFVLSASVLIICQKNNLYRIRIATACCIFLISVTVWIGVRAYLGQLKSHPLTGGRDSLGDILNQLAMGVGELLAPRAFGPLIVIILAGISIWLFQRQKDEGLKFILCFCGITIFLLILIFLSTPINATLSGRFIIFSLMMIIPAIMLRSARSNFWLFLVVILLTMPILLYRSYKWGYRENFVGLILPSAEISRIPAPEQIVVVGNRMLVGPSAWEEPDGADKPDTSN